MKLAFYQPHICLHGTTVSYNEYAKYNQQILGNESIMFYDKSHKGNDDLAIKKFSEHTELVGMDGNKDMVQLERLIDSYKCDAIYFQKCGKRDDGRFITNIPSLVHVVGWENDPHGHVYAYVSRWMSEKCSNSKYPYVPYIVDLPDSDEDFRDEYNIPKESIVFSRLGGNYSWDIPFASEAVRYILNKRNDIYFLFAQTPKFINHPRAIFIDKVVDILEKRKFINTSDAMIHARSNGESFGMACAEYSFCNKRVITYNRSNERNHIDILGEKGIYYSNYNDLIKIFSDFEKKEGDFNCYKQFSPENVMRKFNDVFLKRL